MIESSDQIPRRENKQKKKQEAKKCHHQFAMGAVPLLHKGQDRNEVVDLIGAGRTSKHVSQPTPTRGWGLWEEVVTQGAAKIRAGTAGLHLHRPTRLLSGYLTYPTCRSILGNLANRKTTRRESRKARFFVMLTVESLGLSPSKVLMEAQPGR